MNRTEYKESAERYIRALPSLGRSEQTIKAVARTLRSFGTYIEQNSVDAITSAVIEEYRIWLHGTVKNSTIATYLTLLQSFFAWCVRMGTIEQNPVLSELKPKPEIKEYDLLSREEIQILLHSDCAHGMHVENYARNKAIVCILLTSGIRNSELRALTPSDLCYEEGYITVRHGKGDKYRTVPFPALAQNAVKAYMSVRPRDLTDRDLLFGSSASSCGIVSSQNRTEWHELSSAALLNMINSYTRTVCGHEVGVHTLRHAAASYWDDCGVAMRDVQTALGHSSVNTTEKIYVTVLRRDKAAKSINAVYAL